MALKSMSWVSAFIVVFVVALGGPEAAEPDTEAKQPGQVFRDCSDCPEMVVIPAGSFLMGASDAEMQREIDASPPDVADLVTQYFNAERPQHEVTIARPFAMGRYFVTRGEFAGYSSVSPATRLREAASFL